MYIIDGKEYSEAELKVLLKAGALSVGRKNDPASTSLAGTPALQGPLQSGTGFGLFTRPGTRPERFSALTRPYSLAQVLPLMPSEYSDELLEVMTGVTASTGTNADDFCGNPPGVGIAKVARQVFRWGDYYVKTNLNAVPLIGQLRNRADVAGQILNAAAGDNPFIPDVLRRMTDTRDQLAYELWLVGVSLERSVERVLIVGTRSDTGANREHGFIREFDGLSRFIKTGYTDTDTGVLAPALDSAVVTWNASITATVGGRNFVTAVADTWFGLQQRAQQMGMPRPDYVLVMRADLFRAAVEQFACTYQLTRCNFSGNTDGNRQDVGETRRLYDSMMQGQFLMVEGEQIPVVFSDGMVRQTVAANTYKGDMFFVPVSWQGRALTYMQYFNLGNAYAQEYANYLGNDTQVMNNGLYRVGVRSTGLCKEYHFASRMRLIAETPHLMGRIDGIQYTFQAPIRDALPGDSFYADGGITYVAS